MTLRTLIQQRIIDADCGFKEVAGAADLESVLANRLSMPGCYLFRQQVSVTGNDMITALRQRVATTLSVVVVTQNVRDARGGDSSDDNEALCLAVQTSLLNWQPATDYDPLEYAGGRLITFRNGLFIWQDSYKTHHYLRKP